MSDQVWGAHDVFYAHGGRHGHREELYTREKKAEKLQGSPAKTKLANKIRPVYGVPAVFSVQASP